MTGLRRLDPTDRTPMLTRSAIESCRGLPSLPVLAAPRPLLPPRHSPRRSSATTLTSSKLLETRLAWLRQCAHLPKTLFPPPHTRPLFTYFYSSVPPDNVYDQRPTIITINRVTPYPPYVYKAALFRAALLLAKMN
jgi:hypothetical protein